MDSTDSAICDFTQYKPQYAATGYLHITVILCTIFLLNMTSQNQTGLSLNNFILDQTCFNLSKGVSDTQEHNR
jgi:hypothetical protein